MSSGISFSGLFSGIDWRTMVDQLISVERNKETIMANKQTELQTKLTAWQDLGSKLNSLRDTSNSLRKVDAFNKFIFSSSTSTTDPAISGAVAIDATPGNHTIKTTQLAQERKLSSKEYTDNETALNLTGEIVINGQAIQINSTDTLIDIKDTINLASVGVNADIVSSTDTDFRLILTSETLGDDGFTIFDASTTDVLQSLGITDTNSSINNPISNGAESERYIGKTSIIKSLLDLTTGNSGTVNINGTGVAINLSTDTLESIATAIDAVAGVTATVEEETVDSETKYYLKIQGTTNFTDSNNILKTLGVLKGGLSQIAEVQTGNITNTTDGSTAITAGTTWANIFGANTAVNDTISFTGKKHNGDSVSGSLTIDDTAHTVQELLDAINTAFASEVTATISDGKILLTDNTTGDSYMSLSITENNEGGGILDFGTVSATTKGRKREIQEGLNSNFELDGIPMSKDTNNITDALPGLTLNLLKASSSTTVNFSIARDVLGIKDNIKKFVDLYNDNIKYINSQFKWDNEKKQGGTLMGDGSLINVQSQINLAISSQVTGLSTDYLSYLSEIGINSDNSGVLSITESTLTAKLTNDFDNVKKLFIAFGRTSDNDIEFIANGINSIEGTYDVNITAAAEKAAASGTTAINGGGITSDENLTITDIYTDRIANVALSATDTISTIISKINTAFQTEVAEVRTGSTANTTDGATAITAASTWAQIFGANVAVDDTITISGTDHDGNSVSGTLTIDNTSNQVQELLDKIESIYGSGVTASINTDGKILINDRQNGDSSLTLTLYENNEGSGTLDFGDINLTTEGRGTIPISASNSSGKLTFTHDDYGASYGVKVVSDVADLADGNSTGIGTTLITDYGVDVEGTINGETATGNGQTLTGISGQTHIAGLAIRSTLTPSELVSQGSDQGTITLTLGNADRMYTLLKKITDSYEGYVTLRQNSIKDTIDDYQEQINKMELSLDKERIRLTTKFTTMEKLLASLDSQRNFLNSQFK